MRSATIVWKLSSASSRPCEISGWYGVCGVHAGFEHVAQDDERRDRVVVAEADERREHLVALREGAQLGEHLGFVARVGERQRFAFADRARHARVDQRVEGGEAECGEHLRLRVGAGSDVTVRKRRFGVGDGLGAGDCGHGWFPLGSRGSVRPCGEIAGRPSPLSADLRFTASPVVAGSRSFPVG